MPHHCLILHARLNYGTRCLIPDCEKSIVPGAEDAVPGRQEGCKWWLWRQERPMPQTLKKTTMRVTISRHSQILGPLRQRDSPIFSVFRPCPSTQPLQRSWG